MFDYLKHSIYPGAALCAKKSIWICTLHHMDPCFLIISIYLSSVQTKLEILKRHYQI